MEGPDNNFTLGDYLPHETETDTHLACLENICNSNGLKIVNYNVGGLNTRNFELIESILHSNSNKGGIDLLNVSETWLKPKSRRKNLDIEGYKFLRQDRQSNVKSKGGGLITYYSDKLDVISQDFKRFNRNDENFELFIYKVKGIEGELIICHVYKPPNSKIENISPLNDFLSSLSQNCPLLVCGDLNVNQLLINRNKQYLDCVCLGHSLRILNKKTPTHFKKGKGSVIDLICTNLGNEEIACNTVIDFTSNNPEGHLPTGVTVKFSPKVISKNVNFISRNLRNMDQNKFLDLLNNYDWENFLEKDNLEECWNIFIRIISESLDEVAPLKRNTKKKINKSWLNGDALLLINTKNNLFKKARRTGREIDWARARDFQKRVNKEVQLIRNSYIKNENFNFKDNPSKFWKSANQFMNPNKNSKNPLADTDLMDEEKGEICEKFGKFFSTVGSEVSEGIQALRSGEIQQLDQRTFSNSNKSWNRLTHGEFSKPKFELHNVNESTVSDIIMSIKSCKSSGIDNMPNGVLKQSMMVLIRPLTHIINLSLSKGEFLDCWKNVKVVPLYKGEGDTLDPGGYRPISLVPTISKVIEKCVLQQMNKFLSSNCLLSKNQHGFRAGYSINTAINSFLNFTYNNVSKKESTLISYIDLRKAFDTVNHDVLLSKLVDQFNFGISSLNWIRSFLSNRHLTCNFLGKKSNKYQVTAGVPQGSVLGPVLFSLMINDCSDVIRDANIVLYADDTAVLDGGPDLANTVQNMENNLYYMSLWFKHNKLCINHKKSKFSVVSSNKITGNNNFQAMNFGDGKIERVNSYVYLGLTVDEKLDFKEQCNKVIKLCSYRLGQLSRLRNYVDSKLCLLIYKSMILPIINLYSMYYNVAPKKLLNKISSLQNWAIRTASRLRKRESVTHLLHDLGLEKFEDTRLKKILEFGFTLAKHTELLDKTHINTRSHATGRKQLTTNSSNVACYRKSFTYLAVHYWNLLPNEYHQIERKNIFNSLIKSNLGTLKGILRVGVG